MASRRAFASACAQLKHMHGDEWATGDIPVCKHFMGLAPKNGAPFPEDLAYFCHYLANPVGKIEKLDGFELGAAPHVHIR